MMNKLQKDLGHKGLVVVGVTNEPESLVSKDVEKAKMRHPILMTKGEDNERNYGIRGFPSGYLIDPAGYVVWEGHPGNLDLDWLTELVGTVTAPPPVPDQFKDIKAHFAVRKFGKAHPAIVKALDKTPDDPDLKAASDFVTRALEAKLAEAKDADATHDYGRAMQLYTEVTAQFEGAPGAEAGKAGADALKKNKEAADDLAAHGKLQAAIALWRKGDLEKAVKAYAAVAKKHPDTPSGLRAASLADRGGS